MGAGHDSVRVIFGVPIAAARMADVVALAERRIEAGDPLLVGVVNAAKLVHMTHQAPLREAVLASDIILADGMSVVWASRLLGRSLPERVAGIDLMMELLALADRRRLRVFFFGATEEVSKKVVEVVRHRHPGAEICGRRNGYYQESEEPGIVEVIRAARPDLLFVAMSPPKKEIFLERWRERLGAKVMHGVGGAFDVLAGKTRRAPLMWQRLGMEWLYRVVQEPRRMWRRYLTTNLQFLAMLIQEWISPRPAYRAPSRAAHSAASDSGAARESREVLTGGS